MFKFFILSLLTLSITTSCATKELSTDTENIKKRDRIYSGTLNLEFNGKKNRQTNCDVFLSSSFNADFKIPDDGFIVYTSKAKETYISKIACPFQNGKEKIWVYYKLDLEPITKTKSNKDITYFGNVDIKWTITEKDILAWSKNLARVSNLVENVGKYEIKITSDFQNFSEVAKKKVKQLQVENTEFKLSENIFKRDQDSVEKEEDESDDDSDE